VLLIPRAYGRVHSLRIRRAHELICRNSQLTAADGEWNSDWSLVQKRVARTRTVLLFDDLPEPATYVAQVFRFEVSSVLILRSAWERSHPIDWRLRREPVEPQFVAKKQEFATGGLRL
jgi:hypothetical protein